MVLSYSECEADAAMPVHDVTKAQGRTDGVCDRSIGSMERIMSEGNDAICIAPCVPTAFDRVGHFSSLKLTTPQFHDNIYIITTDFHLVGEGGCTDLFLGHFYYC
jgi:hypothetical protein